MPLAEVAALGVKAAEIGIVIHAFNLCLAAVKRVEESREGPPGERVTLTTKALTVTEAFLLLWLDPATGEVPGRTTGGVLHMLLGGAMLLDLQIREVVVIQEPIHKEHGGTSYPRGRESSQAVRAANGSASDSGARLPMTSVSYSNLSKSSSRKLAETLRDAFSSSHLVLQRPYSYTDVDYLDHCVVRPLLEREQR
mmetsp:Transcript_13858/g.50480  ORF Transcript_13858/g.50480 Transcript_13858/m.50480 type:complete len:196 (-) Transcript_13858:1197-1784(-)